VAVIRQRNGSFGAVSEAETPIEISFVVYNPKDVPIVVSELGYNVTMNGIDIGEGVTERTYLIEPRSSERIETTVRLQNERLDEWWVSHIRNDQETRLFIDFSARLSVEGVAATTVPLEGLDYGTTFETNIFGGRNDSSDGQTTTTADGRTETDSTPTTNTGDDGTTTAGGEGTTTDDDGILGQRGAGGFISGDTETSPMARSPQSPGRVLP
jgi:LEA14-like dessication related protein